MGCPLPASSTQSLATTFFKGVAFSAATITLLNGSRTSAGTRSAGAALVLCFFGGPPQRGVAFPGAWITL